MIFNKITQKSSYHTINDKNVSFLNEYTNTTRNITANDSTQFEKALSRPTTDENYMHNDKSKPLNSLDSSLESQKTDPFYIENGEHSNEEKCELEDEYEENEYGVFITDALHFIDTQPDTIRLSTEQNDQALRIRKKFIRHTRVFDTSNTGKGKSIIASWILLDMEIENAIMVCPNSMVPVWNKYKDKYGLPFKMILTYETLRGTKTDRSEVVLKHNLLIRRSDVSFEVTDYFRELVENGLVLVFDEFQKVKNVCDQQRAVTTLTGYMEFRRQLPDTPLTFSGSYFISTTPFDKPEHCVNFCYTTSIITHPQLVCRDTGKPLGILELYNYCLTINPEKTNLIWGTSDLKSKNAVNVAYHMCVEVLFPEISSFIQEPLEAIKKNSRQTIYNVFCDIPEEGMELLRAANSMIHATTALTPITDCMNTLYSNIINKEFDLRCRSGITHGQITDHVTKTFYAVVLLAMQALEQVPNCKVVIFSDYKEAIHVANMILGSYDPIVITGSNSPDSRDILRAKFQEPNLNYRVCITMNQISAIGVEYDDKDGRFPRFGISIPGHVISNLVQSPGRLDRNLTMSNNIFLFVKVDTEENIDESVNRSIDGKSKVFRETLKNNGIIPPNSFQTLYNYQDYNFGELLENAGTIQMQQSPEVKEVKKIIISRSTIKKNVL